MHQELIQLFKNQLQKKSENLLQKMWFVMHQKEDWYLNLQLELELLIQDKSLELFGLKEVKLQKDIELSTLIKIIRVK